MNNMTASKAEKGTGRRRTGASGFTLLEMLVALIILAIAMTIVWQTFSLTIKAWKKGEQFLAEMHHGDFVMEQLTEALRSAAYFDDSGGVYGFRLEDRETGRYPNDVLSWVKSGSAFMPPDATLAAGLHRVDFTVEPNDEGDPATFVCAYPHLADKDEDEFAEGESWEISSVVKGVDCRVYIEEEEDWSEQWENTNEIPALVELTLFMDPLEEGEDPVTVKRAVEIPISRDLKSGVIFDEGKKSREGPRDEEAAEAARREQGRQGEDGRPDDASRDNAVNRRNAPADRRRVPSRPGPGRRRDLPDRQPNNNRDRRPSAPPSMPGRRLR